MSGEVFGFVMYIFLIIGNGLDFKEEVFSVVGDIIIFRCVLYMKNVGDFNLWSLKFVVFLVKIIFCS